VVVFRPVFSEVHPAVTVNVSTWVVGVVVPSGTVAVVGETLSQGTLGAPMVKRAAAPVLVRVVVAEYVETLATLEVQGEPVVHNRLIVAADGFSVCVACKLLQTVSAASTGKIRDKRRQDVNFFLSPAGLVVRALEVLIGMSIGSVKTWAGNFSAGCQSDQGGKKNGAKTP
jgi:hypothetical protein